jgi:hypothetical protein
MQIIHRAISTHVVNKAGFSNKQAKTGAVTLSHNKGKKYLPYKPCLLAPRVNMDNWPVPPAFRFMQVCSRTPMSQKS